MSPGPPVVAGLQAARTLLTCHGNAGVAAGERSGDGAATLRHEDVGLSLTITQRSVSPSQRGRPMERRKLLRSLAFGSVATVAVPAAVALTEGTAQASLETGPDAASYMNNMGVGMYSDMTTAEQMSTFTIMPHMVTCGVGTFGPLGESGPFAMLMYSVRIKAYKVNKTARTINATGRMRSITRIAGQTLEDVEHNFNALATDFRGAKPDTFDVAFITPFWTPGLANPLAMKSTRVPGWAHFGGKIVRDLDKRQLGGVRVTG